MRKVCSTRRSYKDLIIQCLRWSEKSGVLSLHKHLPSYSSFLLQSKKVKEELNELVLAYFKLVCYLDEAYVGEGLKEKERDIKIAEALDEIEDACGDIFISLCTMYRVFLDIKLNDEDILKVSSSIAETFKKGLRVDSSELEEKGCDDVYILCFTLSLSLEKSWASSYRQRVKLLLELFYIVGKLFTYLKSDTESALSGKGFALNPPKSLILSSYNHIRSRRYQITPEGQFIK